jgi:hypothetical protein
MEDDFYQPLSDTPADGSGFLSNVFSSIIAAPFATSITLLLTLLLTALATRQLSGRQSHILSGKYGQTVWLLPYWMPFIGHGFQL